MELGLNTYERHFPVDRQKTLGRIALNAANMYKVMHLDGSENTAVPKRRE